jgi:methionine sulfoxide reductase heme-binding subunit
MKWYRKAISSKWTKVALFVAGLLPALALVWGAFHHGLTANPIEYITHQTGDWILIFLVLTLAISPARKLLGLPELIRFRRMLGLYAFFYAFLHFSIWIGLDKFFDWSDMTADVMKRRFITVGFIGFVLLIPLAVTSTAGWIRRLGGKRWQRLHALVYVTAAAGVIHFYWLVKSNVRKPLRYGVIFLLLFLFRYGMMLRDKRKRPVTAPRAFASTAS